MGVGGQIAYLTNVTGASNWNAGSYNTSPSIYGGVAGDYSPCTQDGTTACNTCTGTTACNSNRIYPNLQLTITAVIVGGIQQSPYGNYAYLVSQTSNGIYQQVQGTVGELVYAEGSEVSFSTTWSNLCDSVGATTTNSYGKPDCATNTSPYNLFITIQPSATFNSTLMNTGSSQQVNLYVLGPLDSGLMNPCLTTSSTTTAAYGFCNFYANAGDSEVYIENPAENISCPASGGATGISGARVFYVPDDGTQNFTTITYASPHQDLQLDANCSPLGNWTVTGLTNGQGYFFLISVLDAANNNSLLLDNSATSILYTTNGGPCAPTGPYNTAEIDQCLQYSVPGQVVGLIPNSVKCFIATAAFGSPLAPVVKTLRQWRDQFLLPYHFGRAFVRYYYRHSPYFAVRIRNSPMLKHITQAALIPVWSVAWLMLNYGSLGTILIIAGVICLIVYTARESRA